MKHWMKHHPVKANSLLCFSLWVAGDSLAQWSEHRMNHNDDDEYNQFSLNHYDVTRTAQCAGYGAFVTGPLVALWYPLLDKMTVHSLRGIKSSSPWAGPIFKVLLDEFVMDPPQIAVFFGYMTACEGGTYPDFRQKMKQEFWNTWLTSLAVWPIVLLGTFRFLPLYAQAPVINACAIVWDGFLSYRNNAGRIMHEESNANAPLLSGSS